MTLLRQAGWTRWPTEVPSNPYHSVILWFPHQHKRALLGTPSVPQASEIEPDTCGSWWCTTAFSCITQFGIAQSSFTWISSFRGKPWPSTSQLEHQVRGNLAAFLLALQMPGAEWRLVFYFLRNNFSPRAYLAAEAQYRWKRPYRRIFSFFGKGCTFGGKFENLWKLCPAANLSKSQRKGQLVEDEQSQCTM